MLFKMFSSFSALALLSFYVLSLVSPVVTHAQVRVNEDLRMVIERSLREDPRVQTMPKEKVDALVDALTSEAQAQGVTSYDLTWRPRTIESFVSQPIAEPYQTIVQDQPDWCGAVPQLLCMFGLSFGLIGTAYGIPIALGSICMVLIVVLGYSLAHHRANTGAEIRQ